MNPLLLGLLVAVGIGAGAFALLPIFAGGRADERIKSLKDTKGPLRPHERADKQREERRKELMQSVQRAAADQKKKTRAKVPLDLQLYQAGFKIKKSAWVRNVIILGGLIFVVLFVLQVPLFFSAVIAASVAYLAPRWWLNRTRRKFQSKFLDELPNAIEAMVRGVKSGLPLNDSIRVVAKEVKEPVRSEFVRVLDSQALGNSIEDAIKVIYKRVPLPEVNFFVVVITVQAQAGGNLSEALGNLARVLRDRRKMQAKVKAMSSEAKASAMIIGSLPFIVATLVSFVTPGYLLPLVSGTVGYIALGVAAVMMGTGIFIMSRMIKFDY
ncbi:MAG: type II secretion system F family protein [Hyphomicrobiaceae bacterium]|nr:type II secretion system F family protein [Hyphomicrobiaceae bacterium]MCC0022693.1 type II secretion system F family protein [Hyphomicrobiaceae bacterium]